MLKKEALAIPVVGVAIFNDEGKVFLIKSLSKFGCQWILPGSKVRFGKTTTEVLKKEIKKETNLDIEDIQFLGLRDYITFSKHFIFLEHQAIAKGMQEVLLNEDVMDSKWFDMKEIKELDMANATRAFFNDYLKEDL